MRSESSLREGVRNFKRHQAAVPLVLAILSLGAPSTAQEVTPGSPAELIFGEEVDVRVVNLEVVVENRRGERVSGLGREDFRILVDGQEVGVEYFTEVAEKRAVVAAGSETPPALDEGQAVATNYVLFVDDDHTHVTFRRPVLRGFRDRLAELPAQDQVAVVVQSARRLEILSPFTADREATRAALAELDKGGRYGGFVRAMGRRGALFPTARADRLVGAVGRRVVGMSGFGDYADNMADISMAFYDLQFSVHAVVSTMRALDPPQGRKVLLLLAGNWPTGDFRLDGQGAGYAADRDLLDELIDTANLLGFTVYPMDQQTSHPYMRLWQNLRYVARDTGGKAFMAGSNVAALDIVTADTSDYYWLGFVPEYRRDDQAHDIRVEVLRPGLRVRSRRGYLDLSRRAEADMEAQRALLFPGEAVTESGSLEVEVGAVERVSRRKMSVPVTVYLPVGRFPALPYRGRFLQQLQLRFATIDGLGRQARIPMIPLSLGGGAEPASDDVVLYRTFLSMKRRPHDLVVTVHDPLSRLTASARVVVAP